MTSPLRLATGSTRTRTPTARAIHRRAAPSTCSVSRIVLLRREFRAARSGATDPSSSSASAPRRHSGVPTPPAWCSGRYFVAAIRAGSGLARSRGAGDNRRRESNSSSHRGRCCHVPGPGWLLPGPPPTCAPSLAGRTSRWSRAEPRSGSWLEWAVRQSSWKPARPRALWRCGLARLGLFERLSPADDGHQRGPRRRQFEPARSTRHGGRPWRGLGRSASTEGEPRGSSMPCPTVSASRERRVDDLVRR